MTVLSKPGKTGCITVCYYLIFAPGIGPSNIYERTRFYDGSVDIQTTPGKGCTGTASIPFL
jgi:hypothetical protein